jgi:DNA invertase Pin-like site-specific DNA recombinase
MKTNAVAFYRVSTMKQDNERQKEDIERYCKAYDFNIIQSFEEKISGASNLEERTELLNCLQYVETNKPDILIVSELSRLGRTNDVLNIIKQLNNHQICFISLKENLITLDKNKQPNPTTQLIINILAGINEFELSTISYRITSGKNNKVVNFGSFGGGLNIPYGYKVVDKKLVINESEAIIINDIFDKFNLSWGCIKIANYLNNNKVETRAQKNYKLLVNEGKVLTKTQINNKNAQWSKSTIYQILKNRLYIGFRKWNCEELEYNEDLQIIDEIVFNKASKRTTESKQNNFDFNKQKKYDYLFDNKIIKCGNPNCNKHFIGIDRYKYYKCISGKYSKGCGINAVNINWLDNAVQKEIVKNWLFLMENNTEVANNISLYQSEIELIKAEKERELKKQNRLIDMYAESKMSKSAFDVKYNNSVALLKRIETNLKEKESKLIESTQIQQTIIKAEYKLNKKTRKYEQQTLNIDKEVLHQIIKNITVNNKKIRVNLVNNAKFEINRPEKLN